MSELPSYMQQTKQFRAKKGDESERAPIGTYKEKAAKGDYATATGKQQFTNRRNKISAAEAKARKEERERREREVQDEVQRVERGDELRKVVTKGDVQSVKDLLARQGNESYPVDQPSDDGTTALMKGGVQQPQCTGANIP